jgi:glycine cleavage system H protein
MSSVPAELRYTKEHEWIQEISATKFRIGITDYAQSALGDIVYIQLPKNGSSEIYAPITGKVVLVNDKLESNPEIINADPYGAGWIAEIEISTDSLQEVLLSAQEYQSLTA